MTDIQEAPAEQAAPAPLVRGRYAIFEAPDGGWAIARTESICERCQGCGCGEQAAQIDLPPMLIPFITGQASLSPGKALGMLKGLMGNG